MNPVLSFYLRRLIRSGTLHVTDWRGVVHTFGDRGPPVIGVRFNDAKAERLVALNPSLAFGECYMDGRIDMLDGEIFDILKLVFENVRVLDVGKEPWMKAIEAVRRIWRRAVQNNTPRRAVQNVSHHYDLSAAFYGLFLDDDRQYSCAYFETAEDTLETAQTSKKRHIAAKLVLDRDDLRVLDIGSGWGGLGLYLAQNAGARVEGVTLSVEQQSLSARRATDAGLDGRLRFTLKDYRETQGTFDRIVSVGMFEHVGRDFYDGYFGKCADLLDADGVMLLHTIGRTMPPRNTNSFIAKYIFPGGYIPALSEATAAIERSGLIVADVEILRLHYAQTLRHWRMRFSARRGDAKAIYDERFCRMWEFYLAASECAFRWQDLVVFQFQLAKRHGVVPTTRDYMASAEDRLRRAETRRRGGESVPLAAE